MAVVLQPIRMRVPSAALCDWDLLSSILEQDYMSSFAGLVHVRPGGD